MFNTLHHLFDDNIYILLSYHNGNIQGCKHSYRPIQSFLVTHLLIFSRFSIKQFTGNLQKRALKVFLPCNKSKLNVFVVAGHLQCFGEYTSQAVLNGII